LPPRLEKSKTKAEINNAGDLAVQVVNQRGLHLSDLNELVSRMGMLGDDPFICLCISGIDTHSSRIVAGVENINSTEDGPGGILYLHVEGKLEKEINKAVGE
jgi:hypothetical protein